MPDNHQPLELALPPHYDPARVDQVWRVPYQERAMQARQWAQHHGLAAATNDRYKLGLLLVDVQNTFCLPEFELFVGGRSGRGAVEDNQRLCEFIYRNLGRLTRVMVTMDTHHAMQIFHPVFLVDANGKHPDPLTLVSHEDVMAGKWQFNPQIASQLGLTPQEGQAHLEHYTGELRKREKFDLTIWPYHAMLGGIGHALVSAVEEALFFYTITRQSQPETVIKGSRSLTEHYSAIGPEVLEDSQGNPMAKKDRRVLHLLEGVDALVIAGQAKSHCVSWTTGDLLEQVQASDPSLAGKVYLLEDCTSPVVVPGVVDYTDQANADFQRFQQAGMHVVKSTQPLSEWPGFARLAAES